MFMDEFEVGAIVVAAPFQMSYGCGVKARTMDTSYQPPDPSFAKETPMLHLQKETKEKWK